MTHYRIGVIGGGLMGADIFHFLSDLNFPLVWAVRREEAREALEKRFARKIDRIVRSGAIEEQERRSLMERILITTTLDDLSGCTIVIEAITEDVEMKRRLFMELEDVLPDTAVIATNTSSIRPSTLASVLRKRDRFAGLHFFYPVHYRNITELILTDETGEHAREALVAFLALIGRRHIEMHEREGFMLNRVLLDLQAAAYRIHHDEGIPLGTIDAIVKRDIIPAGVFSFFDGVGIDVAFAAIQNYVAGTKDAVFYEPLLCALHERAMKGRMGRKSGAGFYSYPVRESGADECIGEGEERFISLRLISLYLNSAFRAMEKGICPDSDIDYAIREYMDVDRGPIAMADEMGRERIRSVLNEGHRRTGFDAFIPSGAL